MKKGQLMSQPLFWVLALIVGGLILVWGLTAVMDLGQRANYIQVLDAQEEIQKNIDAYSNFDPGSSKNFQVSFPNDIDWVCFSDSSGATDCLLSDGSNCNTAISNDDLEDLLFYVERSAQGSGENLFLLPLYAYDLTRFYIGPIVLEQSSVVCFENGESYRIKSQGTYVQIS